MSLLQGDPLPSIETTKEIVTTGPDWYNTYLEDLAKSGTDYLSKTGEELVAGFDPLQQNVILGAESALTSYEPFLEEARGQFQDLAGGFDTSRVSDFMNPYTTLVTDEMARLAQQNVQRNLLPTLKGAFSATGGAGSQRMLGALGQMGADVQANLTGQQTKALQEGYNDALRAMIDEAAFKRGIGSDLLSTAARDYELDAKALEEKFKYGTAAQQLAQAQIMAPLTAATGAANIFANLKVPTTVSEEAFGPIPGAYSTSPLSQIAGLSSLFAAAPGGTSAFSNVLNAGSDFAKWIGGFGGSGDGTTVYDNLDPDA